MAYLIVTGIVDFPHRSEPLSEAGAASSPLKFAVDAPAIYTGPRSTVYYGSLTIRVGDSKNTHKAVLKTAVDGAHLIHEASVYEKCKCLQGDALPKFFGVFTTPPYENIPARTTSVMLFAGPEMLKEQWKAPKMGAQLFEIMRAIHYAGFDILDNEGEILYSHHIRDPDGSAKPMLISFTDALPHNCKFPKDKKIIVGTFFPHIADIGCKRLSDLASILTFWRPSFVEFYGTQIPLDAFVTAEELVQEVEDALGYKFTDEVKEKALRKAERIVYYCDSFDHLDDNGNIIYAKKHDGIVSKCYR